MKGKRVKTVLLCFGRLMRVDDKRRAKRVECVPVENIQEHPNLPPDVSAMHARGFLERDGTDKRR